MGKKSQKRQGKRALQELTPAAMQDLLRMFYTRYTAQMAPQMMAAQQGLDARAARTGMTHAGVSEQLRAGIPGQFAESALSEAGRQAGSVASQRANIIAGQPALGYGQTVSDIGNLIGLYGLLRNKPTAGDGQQRRANQQAGSPWYIEGPGHGTVNT